MSSEIVQQRAEIEGVIAGRTLCDELRHVAETSGDAYAYSEEAVTGADAGAGDSWQSLNLVAGEAAGAGSGSRFRRPRAGAR